MYTVDQINKSVEFFIDAHDDGEFFDDESNYTRDYPEGHWGHGKFKQSPPEGWSDFDDEGFLVIDGVFVDFKTVETTGGEGEGDAASVTFKVGNQYFRKEGYYASHYGYDWDGDLLEVKPVLVERTEYVPVD